MSLQRDGKLEFLEKLVLNLKIEFCRKEKLFVELKNTFVEFFKYLESL